jgi:Arc/MetJ-type ribon-helix-helix transcriptional regulator
VGTAKKKAVFTAEPEQLEKIEAEVRSGRYRSASEFLREAIREKLARLRRERLTEQVASYCAEGRSLEDEELIGLQALDDEDR